ncbi:MAG: helix-turn-helix transcriptional regulator [Odoribacteraceae bacterium]|jgi:transcriptional regulator with XRE-family HTH domain|nr:helix-turn-helix transcriptional regulator [Odoribacteraceae bacterium]
MKKSDLLEEVRATIPVGIKKEMDLSFAIVDRIHAILVKKGMTQRDFARAIGKSEAEISKWMRGTHNFTIRTISLIEYALGESLVEVTGKRIESYHMIISIPASAH